MKKMKSLLLASAMVALCITGCENADKETPVENQDVVVSEEGEAVSDAVAETEVSGNTADSATTSKDLEEKMKNYDKSNPIVFGDPDWFLVYEGQLGDKEQMLVFQKTADSKLKVIAIMDDVETEYDLGTLAEGDTYELSYTSDTVNFGIVALPGDGDGITGVYSADGITYEEFVMHASRGITGNVYDFSTKEEIENFARDIQKNFEEENISALADKVIYPFTIRRPGETEDTIINNKEEFMENKVSDFFTGDALTAILETKCHYMFTTDGMIMLGDGQVWFGYFTPEDNNVPEAGLYIYRFFN